MMNLGFLPPLPLAPRTGRASPPSSESDAAVSLLPSPAPSPRRAPPPHRIPPFLVPRAPPDLNPEDPVDLFGATTVFVSAGLCGASATFDLFSLPVPTPVPVLVALTLMFSSTASSESESELESRRLRLRNCCAFSRIARTRSLCSFCCRSISSPYLLASRLSCSFFIRAISSGFSRHFSLNASSANLRSASPRRTGSLSARLASLSLSNASLASKDGFLSGCTASERLRYALEICPSVTSHTGLPPSSQSGLGSNRQLK
mmetsp:Transcript_37651/g.93615  ORF Transcript_37651/g.93615 Transcript_37651/m.93615 type:complete len:260 (+) Transcript_37651:246-1025(+)